MTGEKRDLGAARERGPAPDGDAALGRSPVVRDLVALDRAGKLDYAEVEGDRERVEAARAASGASRPVVTVNVWRDTLDGGFVVSAPLAPGCVSQGESISEVLEHFADAFAEWAVARAVHPEREQERNRRSGPAYSTSRARQRYATNAVTAPLLWHYLDPDGYTRYGRRALCGERRRRWERLETFSVPSAAEPCQMCVAVDAGMRLHAE